MSESKLEDRAAIHDLFTRYCCALDNGEIEAVVDCFTVDAILKITGNRAAASAYLLVLISKDGNHRSLPPGRYVCELIKADSGQWRFSRRTVFHDHDYTLDGIGR
jgi:ketosteroid isomerase-like protein